MPTRVAVVALKMQIGSLAEECYRDMPFNGKVERLTQLIQAICEQLASIEPDSKWLIVWAEHGVNWLNGEPVSDAQKKYFKAQMSAISSEYPQLAIIAGTIKSSKDIDAKTFEKKSAQLEKAYKKSAWIADVEDEYRAHPDQDQYAQHRKAFNARSKVNADQARPFVRNTAYIFSNGQCVARHDKLAPARELAGGHAQIFQVGKDRNESCYITISFDDGVSIPVGVEICREHSVGVLKRECETRQLPEPLIHFVLADSVSARKSTAAGKYFMHVDTQERLLFLNIAGNGYADMNVVGYNVDVFSSAPELRSMESRAISMAGGASGRPAPKT